MGSGCLQQEHRDSTNGEEQQWVRVALASQDGKTTYASSTFMVNRTSADWEVYNATLSPHRTDTEAKLTIAFEVRRAWRLPQ